VPASPRFPTLSVLLFVSVDVVFSSLRFVRVRASRRLPSVFACFYLTGELADGDVFTLCSSSVFMSCDL